MIVISAIAGSTRQSRFSEKPAKEILRHQKKCDGVDATARSSRFPNTRLRTARAASCVNFRENPNEPYSS